jgi:hypothetical protein
VPGFSFASKKSETGEAHASTQTNQECAMAPTTYVVEMTAAEKALKLARDAGDVAAMLAALATITRLVRQRYWAAKLAS